MPSKLSNAYKFGKIINDIKKVKIQGARNIAKKALYAYSLLPNSKSERLLLSSRPTEPMLERVLKEVKKTARKLLLN